ncbi:MAG TPA: aquaporin [Ktedonobacteraceae bacterium]|nr:aquaporin [Ktedonobacteraceae bacterium]
MSAEAIGSNTDTGEQTHQDTANTSTEEQKSPTIWQKLLAEALGTLLLTFVAAGSSMMMTISHGEVTDAAHAVAPGLVIMAMIYSVGSISGAHFNPVVTLAFTLRKDFPWKRIPGYWAAQLLGAVLAALLLQAILGPVKHVGATIPDVGVIPGLAMEIVLTFLLVTVILATATNKGLVGHNASIAVGGTIALCGLFADPVSGASMNPARSLGPVLISGYWTDAWIYLVGPFVGALLAVAVAWLLRGETTPEAAKTAQGS